MNTFVSGVSTGVNPNEKWQDLRQKQKLPWEHFHHCPVHKPHKHKITIPFALPYSSHFNIYFPMLHHTYVDHIQTDHIIKAESNITTNKSGISTNKTNIQKNVENIKTDPEIAKKLNIFWKSNLKISSFWENEIDAFEKKYQNSIKICMLLQQGV